MKKYLEHLNHLEMMSEKRKMEKKNNNLKENTVSYEEFGWMEMLNKCKTACKCSGQIHP